MIEGLQCGQVGDVRVVDGIAADVAHKSRNVDGTRVAIADMPDSMERMYPLLVAYGVAIDEI